MEYRRSTMITQKDILEEDWFVWWRYSYDPRKLEDAIKELWEQGTLKEKQKIMNLLKKW